MSMIRRPARERRLARESDIAEFGDPGEKYAIRRLWTAIEVLEADNKLLRERLDNAQYRIQQLEFADHEQS